MLDQACHGYCGTVPKVALASAKGTSYANAMDINLVVLALVAALWIYLMLGKTMGKVAPQRARELVERGALLLDVRTPQEFSSAHLEGAKNIPLADLESRLAECGAKEQSIVVYCRSGARSGAATKLLKKHGFVEVNDLGAMRRWKAGA